MLTDDQIYKIASQGCVNSYDGRHGDVVKCFTKVIEHVNGTLRWFECYYDIYLFIIIEGTHNKMGWVYNLYYKQIKVPQWGRGVKVHEGLYNEAYLGYSDMIKVLAKHRGPVVIAGHSKGGGIAPIVVKMMKSSINTNIVYCVGEGMPRIGNRAFKKAYNELGVKTILFWYKNDPVPHLPFRKTPAIWITRQIKYLFTQYTYCHVVKPTHLGEKTWRDWIENVVTNPKDHEPYRYLRSIKERY